MNRMQGTQLNTLVAELDEKYMDPPSVDADPLVHHYHMDLHKLLGAVMALMASMNAWPAPPQDTDRKDT